MDDVLNDLDSSSWTEVSDLAQLTRQPVVSVLMMTYNHESYLADAIEGVVNQQADFPIELLIGEDCSSDRSREIALHYQQLHAGLIRVIAWNQNAGMHANFRRLFALSRGEFIACCESDDYWVAPDKLQRQVNVFRHRPDVTAVYTDFCVTALTNGKWTVQPGSAFSSHDIRDLSGNLRGKAVTGTLRTLTSIYRANVVAALYARKLPMTNYPFLDGFLVSQAISTGTIETLATVTAVYRETPNSVTRAGPAANLRLVRSVLEFYRNSELFFPEGGPIDPAAIRLASIAVCRCAYIAGDAAAYEDAYLSLCQAGHQVPAYLVAARYLVANPHIRRMSLRVRARLKGVLKRRNLADRSA